MSNATRKIEKNSEEFKLLFEKIAIYYGAVIGENMVAKNGLYNGNLIEAKTFIVPISVLEESHVLSDKTYAPKIVFPYEAHVRYFNGVPTDYKLLYAIR